MLDNEKLKVINFLQDFTGATLEQLQILFDKPKDNFKDILTTNLVSKKVIFLYIIMKNLI